MRAPRLRTAASALATATLASACLFSPRQDPSRYYTLVAVTAPAATAASGLRLGLGPVSLPGYLSRSSLATRVDPSRVEYAQNDRWAEALSSQFLRTLGEDLGRQLGTTQIVLFPWYPGVPLDVAVEVTVLAFETDIAGTAALDAAWRLRNPGTGAVTHEGHSAISEPGDGTRAGAAVDALSRAVDRLARDIAADIARR